MNEPRRRELRDALADWDPAKTHPAPDERSIATQRRRALRALDREAPPRIAPAGWLGAAAAAAVALALAFAFWPARPTQAPRPEHIARVPPPIAAAVVASPQPRPSEPPASPPVAEPVVPTEPRSRAVAVSDQPAATVRRSRIDFRTLRGTRVIWLMRSDFEPASGRTKTF